MIGRPTPCSSGSWVMVSNALESNCDADVGSRVANPGDDLAEKSGSILERPAEVAGSLERAQQLVAEIAVARLDVDEVEPRLLGELGRPDVVADDATAARRR